MLCANPIRIYPYWAANGICGNSSLHAMDNCMRPPLGITTVMGPPVYHVFHGGHIF